MLLYLLEVPHCGTSNEYPQHMFLWKNKKNIFLIPPRPPHASPPPPPPPPQTPPLSGYEICILNVHEHTVLGKTGLSKQWKPRSNKTACGIWSGSTMFATHPSVFRHINIYHIYPKYSDTSTPYHICSKIWTSTIHYPMLCLKIAGRVANSVDPDEMPHSAASHLGLYCLLRPVCPNICGKYGRKCLCLKF